MKKILILVALSFCSTTAMADAVCNDGTYSHGNGSGTCSHHGGVAYWIPR